MRFGAAATYPRLVAVRAVGIVLTVAVLAGCTSSPAGRDRVTHVPTSRSTLTPATTHAPMHETAARSCPLASTLFVRNTIGLRLGKITRLRGGGIAGCRFYGLQDGSLSQSEHLPGPNQPVLEVVVRQFDSAVDAHNAVVARATAGRQAHTVQFGRVRGACFQTAFYPKDHGEDWACGANLGKVEVLVYSVDTTASFSVVAVTRAVLRRV